MAASKHTLKGRPVEIGDTKFNQGEGVSILSAVFTDTDEFLKDLDLEELEAKYSNDLYEKHKELMLGDYQEFDR